MKALLPLIFLFASLASSAQDTLISLNNRIAQLEQQVETLKYTELVQSMSQRSLLTPAYFQELKALVARQAYNFWKTYNGNPLVSHLNVYSALYYANKFLGYDSLNKRAYNQAIGHNESVVSVQFGRDPNYFYSAGSDGRVLRWDVRDPSKVPELIYHGDHLIRSIDIGQDDEWILVVTKNQGIVLVKNQMTPGETDEPLIVRDPETVQTAAFIPGEARILVVNKMGDIKIKGYNGDESIGKTDKNVTSMTMNESTKDFYLGTQSGNFQIWEDTLARKVYLPESFAINTIAVSSDFKQIALGREKGDVLIWDLEEEKFVRKISGHHSAITDIDFSPDNKLLLTASRDRTVRVWDIDTPQKLPLVLDDHDDWVMTACFSPNGKQIVSGSKDNYIRLWPLEHSVLADRICKMVNRNLSQEEWNDYIGSTVDYVNTCPVK